MNFGSSGLSGDNSKKAWKDIWGSGQGIGSIKDSPSVQILVDQLTSEFKEAVEDFNQKSIYIFFWIFGSMIGACSAFRPLFKPY